MSDQRFKIMPKNPPPSQEGGPTVPNVERLKEELLAKTDQVKELKDDLRVKADDVKELRVELRSKAAEVRELKDEFRAQANEVKQLKQDLKAMEEAKKKAEDSLKDPPKSNPVTKKDITGYWSLESSYGTEDLVTTDFTVREGGDAFGSYCSVWIGGIKHRTVSVDFIKAPKRNAFVGALSEDGRTMDGFYIIGDVEHCHPAQCQRH